MVNFEELVATWRTAQFPVGSSDDELDELHADLALADTWVADALIPFLERGAAVSAQVDVLAETSHLQSRASELEVSKAGPDRDKVVAYGRYAGLLHDLYYAYLQRSKSTP